MDIHLQDNFMTYLYLNLLISIIKIYLDKKISNNLMNKMWLIYNPLMKIRLDTTSNLGKTYRVSQKNQDNYTVKLSVNAALLRTHTVSGVNHQKSL